MGWHIATSPVFSALASPGQSLGTASAAPGLPGAAGPERGGLCCLLGKHMLHLVLRSDRWMLCWGWAGRRGEPMLASGSLVFGEGLGEGRPGLVVQARTAPCHRALPEVGRQRVAELRGAAS